MNLPYSYCYDSTTTRVSRDQKEREDRLQYQAGRGASSASSLLYET